MLVVRQNGTFTKELRQINAIKQWQKKYIYCHAKQIRDS